jgi:ribosome-binding factor A
MSAGNHRHERVGEEIAHEINAMLAGELKDPRLEGNVVASEVRVQPDMKHARIFVSVQGSEKERADAIKALEHASGFIRSELVGCRSGACRSCISRWTFPRSTPSASSNS